MKGQKNLKCPAAYWTSRRSKSIAYFAFPPFFFAHFPFHPIHKNELKYYSDSEHHNPFVENTTLGLL